mmetsp:Transcript_4945/g.7057  ORF Transcript_4945/g.7057 Transcript_4945/m.7057 type:complete len:725 (+) Transcript_4945:2032-4206(+)
MFRIYSRKKIELYANNTHLKKQQLSITTTPMSRITEEMAQQVSTTTHETEFAMHAIHASCHSLHLLFISQYPSALTEDQCITLLGSVMVQPLLELDQALSYPLKLMVQEGVLDPHQYNLQVLEESVRNVRKLSNDDGREDAEEEEPALIPTKWKKIPLELEIVANAMICKFACLGASACIASTIGGNNEDQMNNNVPTFMEESKSTQDENEMTSTNTNLSLLPLMKKMDQITNEAYKVSHRLSCLPSQSIHDHDKNAILKEIQLASHECKTQSQSLLRKIQATFSKSGNYDTTNTNMETMANETLQSLSKFMSMLVQSSTVPPAPTTGKIVHHFLSPEHGDPWEGVTSFLTRTALHTPEEEEAKESAPEFNHIKRANAISTKIVKAMENETQLVNLSTKVLTLEKKLQTKSKETNFQNIRMMELEQLLANHTTANPTSDITASPTKKQLVNENMEEALEKIQKENQVLTEALDHLQNESDGYELEIKLLKDNLARQQQQQQQQKQQQGIGSSRTSLGGGSSGGGVGNLRNSSRISLGGDLNASMDTIMTLGLGEHNNNNNNASSSAAASAARGLVLEAAVFRPALHNARMEISMWRNAVVKSGLEKLPPLNIPQLVDKHCIQPQDGGGGEFPPDSQQKSNNLMNELCMASHDYRLNHASVRIVDLTQSMAKRKKNTNSVKNNASLSRIQLREQRRKDAICSTRLENASVAAQQALMKLSRRLDF